MLHNTMNFSVVHENVSENASDSQIMSFGGDLLTETPLQQSNDTMQVKQQEQKTFPALPSKVKKKIKCTSTARGARSSDCNANDKFVKLKSEVLMNTINVKSKLKSKLKQTNYLPIKGYPKQAPLDIALHETKFSNTKSSKEIVKADLKQHELLLLTLLTLNAQERDNYINKVGLQYSFLEFGPCNKSGFVVKSSFKNLAMTLRKDALNFSCEPGKLPVEKNIKTTKIGFFQSNPSQKKMERREMPRTYEENVTLMLNGSLENPRKDLILQSDASGDTTAHLEAFVKHLIEQNTGYLTEGELRVNRKNNFQSFVTDNLEKDDIFISSILLRKNAMDGDYVQVFVKYPTEMTNKANTPKQQDTSNDDSTIVVPYKQSSKRGFVVKIIHQRNSMNCVGTLLPPKQGQQSYQIFIPRDVRIPPLRILEQHLPNALLDKTSENQSKTLYLAKIIEWQNDTPIGSITKSIGKCDELETETAAILMEHNLDVSPYSDEILSKIPTAPFILPPEELHKRADLRNECIFTIDPLTARDLDDALSCRLLENGNFEVGVHISDVTYYLREGSDLDELVKLRATSIYMVDSVHHMLPKPLCSLCSLLPGEDRLTFSVFWEITPSAEILSTRFARTVINSCAQLAYEQAQIMLDNPNDDLSEADYPGILHGYTPNHIKKKINQLQGIAIQLRARRMANGCLKINQPKLMFKLHPTTGKPLSFDIYQARGSNEMIEDFMLLANSSVAYFTHEKFPCLSVLRHHFPPAQNMMQRLSSKLASHGYDLQTSSSSAIRDSMQSIIKTASYPDAAEVALNYLLAKPMKRAKYFCASFVPKTDFYHYALAIPVYTHFTSPIRRYADCLVHRVLAAALNLELPPKRLPDEIMKLSNVCNQKKYDAKLAGEDSSKLYFHQYLSLNMRYETDAAVLDFTAHNMDFVLFITGQVISLRFKKLKYKATLTHFNGTTANVCILELNNKNINPLELRIFSKVRVVVELYKSIITIVTVLPVEVRHPESIPTASVLGDGDHSIEKK